jgi:AraC family transcriptional regulator of adaptative response/methylated-DNA-[protein]-cysteine methyltransferase
MGEILNRLSLSETYLPQPNSSYYAVASCSLGHVGVVSDAQDLCAILLGDTAQEVTHALHQRLRGLSLARVEPGDLLQLQAVQQLIEEPLRRPCLPLAPRGTTFQLCVWRALQDIEPGTTLSYGALAQRLGMPLAVRAVAQACGRNPLAVAIPCHRVVRSDGGLGGYRWGLWRKQLLLRRELRAPDHGAGCR